MEFTLIKYYFVFFDFTEVFLNNDAKKTSPQFAFVNCTQRQQLSLKWTELLK